jgi:hypothetical protein
MIDNNIINIKKTGSFNLKAIIKLILSFTCVILFVLVLAPELDNLAIVKPMVNNIDEKEIDASALFYTEIDEFSAAEIRVNSSLKYSPAERTKYFPEQTNK